MLGIFLRVSLSLTTLLVAHAGTSFASDMTERSQKLCEDSPRCKMLANGEADYPRYEVEVLRVIDADTLEVRVHVWPGHTITTAVRVRGVDAPEDTRRAECEYERQLGLKATRSVERKYLNRWVLLENVVPNRLGYWIEADVLRWRSSRFLSLADELTASEKTGVTALDRNSDFDWCGLEGANDNG